MKITASSLPEVLIVEPQVFGDERGFFMESYQEQKMVAGGIEASFVQDNHSGSQQGILRGLHYQLKQAQGKLVRVVVGEVFDVAVDVRASSPNCGKWFGLRLSAENRRQLWVPPGFAHGFYVLSEWAEFVYKATDYYAPEHERSIRWDDPDIGIAWPLLPGQEPRLSKKDEAGVALDRAELYP